MGKEGWIATLGILIALGLVLKFGGSSVGIIGGLKNALVGETNALTMSGTQGNMPQGAVVG